MPTLPRANPTPVPTAPLAGARVPTGVPTRAFGAPESVPLDGVTRQVAGIIERHQSQADNAILLDADNQLARLETDLRTTATARRGKDALGATDEMQDGWAKGVSAIESSLTNDRQRQLFQARAGNRFAGLYSATESHAHDEWTRFQDSTSATAVQNRVNDALANYRDPQQVAKAAVEARAIVQDQAKRSGWSPEITEQKTGEVLSALHAGVIGRFIAVGDDRAAKAYYDKAKSQIAGKHLEDVDRALEVASTEGAGLRAADAVWVELGPKTANDPARIATMEAKAREQLADDPKVLKATIQELRSRVTAHNAEQSEVTASNKAQILGAFAQGSTVQDLVRTPAYLALSGTEQEQVKSYMLNQAYTTEAREDSAKARRGFAKFWELSEPVALSKMSDNQVLALEPELGRTLVGNLMTVKRSIGKTEAAVRAATIDGELFNTVAQSAGFKPYGKLNEDDKSTLGRLKNAVESEIDLAQQAKGKELTRDEKSKVMQGVIDKQVMLKRFWGDSPAIAALVQQDDRGRVYVPRAEIPFERWDEMRRYVLSLGGAPRPDKLQRMRGAKLINDREAYDRIAREP